MKTIITTALALTALVGSTALTNAGTQVFFDDFNGDQLASHWEVINQDEDSYIVEEGTLLSIASGGANLSKGNVSNIFRMTTKMPKGNWTATIKYRMPYQTGRETPFLALYGDKDNYIAAFANAWSYYSGTRGSRLYLGSKKVVKGKSSRFSDVMWGGSSGKPFSADDLPNPFILRITKSGHSYTAAVQIKQGAETTWIERASLTAIRQPGNLAFGIYQSEKVNGETPMSVDWVKIESAD